MKETTRRILDDLTARYAPLAACRADIERAFETMNGCFAAGGKLLLCGNGGSAADCEHIAGELLKSFRIKRPVTAAFAEKLKAAGDCSETLAARLERGLPVISLCGHPAFSTAFINDSEPLLTYAQQVHALGRKGDVLLSISTSGNAKNCYYAAVTARALGMKTLLLSGRTGGALKEVSDCAVIVPESETYKIQELHLPVYHCLCAMLENEFFA
ncbi:MAG: phosphoheptose isomerase [Bacillota bacterium]|nr:MAG: phosphoheptose isomerase [Bacillota bacterium]